MLIELINKTEEEIKFGEVFNIPPNIKTIVFDSENESTYDIGYIIFKYFEALLTSECFDFYINKEIKNLKEFNLITKGYFYDIFTSTNISFESNSQPPNNFYYSLSENKMKVFNPINKKWYSIQLIETEE